MTTTKETRIVLTPQEMAIIAKARIIISEILDAIDGPEEYDGIGDVDYTVITTDQLETAHSALDDLNAREKWYASDGSVI